MAGVPFCHHKAISQIKTFAASGIWALGWEINNTVPDSSVWSFQMGDYGKMFFVYTNMKTELRGHYVAAE